MIRQFKSDADVQQHFALQAGLGAKPDPPEDLWEQIEQARREAGKIRGTKRHPLIEPDLTALVFPEIKSAQKRHPIRGIECLDSVPEVRCPVRKTYKVKRVL